MKKKPFVSIVICTHNRVESLKKFTLKSIPKLTYPNYEVVVVDDASKGKIKENLKEFKNKIKNWVIIKNTKSKGLCYARNLGIKNSKGEIIVFIDDDCIIDKDWLSELVRPYLKDKQVMVVGGKTYNGYSGKIADYNKKIIGCNMSFRKEVFNKFLFDNNLYFNKSSAGDETELIYRIKNKNLKIAKADKAIIKHFRQPAKYRVNAKIGRPLNKIYMYAKKTPLIRYYIIFFTILLLSKQKRSNRKKSGSRNNINEIIERLDEMRGLFSAKHKIFFKLPWIFYVLLLEIPFKAKIKNWLEERKIKN